MKAVILHLSDIHIKTESDPILTQAENIARAIYIHLVDTSHVFILVSGDIVYSGAKNQYEWATIFLNSIKCHLKNERNINVDFVMCPGNHDCDFDNDKLRSFLLDSVLSQDIEKIDRSIFESCTTHQNGYFEFRDQFEENQVETDKLWVTQKFTVGGKSIVFESVNLAWASKISEEQGKLLFPFSVYTNKSKLDADIRISLMHHPLNWLGQSSYRDFRHNLRAISNFVFTGHEHLSNAVNHDDIESGKTIVIEGGVLQEKTIENSTFGVVTLDLEQGENKYFTYEYCSENNIYAPKEEKLLLEISESNTKCFSFKRSFKDKLDDCGAYFKHTNTSNLKLSDIFVYPNIKKEKVNKSKNFDVSSNKLLSLKKFAKGIILSGEENIGSTSLIYSLITEYASSGYIPILLNGSDLKQKNTNNIDLQIQRALDNQFESKDILNKFNQENTNKKILLIDDFDSTKIKSENAINEILNYLMGKFGKVILTVSSMYEVSQLTSLEDNTTTNSFEHYKIQPFGFVKRSELINKWYSVGQQDHESEAETVGKCNIAERLMDTVMDKSLISPHPIFLLTFLQSIETGQSEQLSDSALGHYYNYLLTESFLDVGIGKNSLGAEIDYCMHLAWFYYKRNTISISIEDFKEFNQYFSDTWQETDFSSQESKLLKAKVLVKNGGDYEFRYHYNYYYLLGMYFSQNILDASINKDIEHCIEHLYVKKNANIILFLAHHSSSDNILVMMKTAADNLFKENVAADFNGGCTVAHELIQDAPKLEFNCKTPQENRQTLSEHKELVEVDKPNGFFKEKEEDPIGLDLATKLTMLFKTIDILSQIIKSNPTKFARPKKVEIIQSVFSAPLRALQDFYNFLEAHPKALIEAIQNELSEKSKNIPKEDRENIARLTVSRIIQGASSLFVLKTAQIVNSQALIPDIPTVINANQTLAFELMEVAISLDNHKPISRKKIQDVAFKCEENNVAKKVLDVIVMNRLHMFKTSEQDMQWLQSKLGYDLTQQHQLGYDRNSKLIKN